MLNSRYIHLHEALGLGVMWLNQTARLQPPTKSEPTVLTTDSPAPPAVANRSSMANVARSKPSHTTIHPARLAALQRVGSRTLQTVPAPVSVPESPKIESLEFYLSTLPAPSRPVRVLALSVCASPADVLAGKLFSGEDGLLLKRMFAAIQLPEEEVKLGTWLTDLPDFNPKPPHHSVIASTPRLQALWQLNQAQALLLMGDFFEREDVLHELDKICPAHARFTIPHPLRILSNPKELRPIAWNGLQQLQAFLQNASLNKP